MKSFTKRGLPDKVIIFRNGQFEGVCKQNMFQTINHFRNKSKIEMSWSKFPQQVSIDAPRALNSHIHPGQQQNVRSPFLNTTNQLRPFEMFTR